MYRPLRGWASAYQPEPSVWARISAGFGRLFARKQVEDAAPSEIEQVADAARELEEEVRELARLEDESQQLLSDPAFFVPEELSDASAPDGRVREEEPDLDPTPIVEEESDSPSDTEQNTTDIADLPVVRDYQLRGGEQVDDLPIVREYRLHSSDDGDGLPERDDIREPEFAGEPDGHEVGPVLEAEMAAEELAPPPRRPGFFARLFGGSKKNPEPAIEEQSSEGLQLEEPAAVVDEEFVPAEPDPGPTTAPVEATEAIEASDESSIVFIDPADLGEADAQTATDEGQATFDPAGLGEPLEIPARSLLEDEEEEQKPGFFARLFGRGRKAKPEPEFESEFESEIEPEPELADTAPVMQAEAEEPARLDRPSLEFFMRVDRAAHETATEPAIPTLDDALPMDEPEPVGFASFSGYDAASAEAQVTSTEFADASVADAPFAEGPTAPLDAVEAAGDPWIPVVPEPEEKKPGFFARLFRRRSEPEAVEEPADLEPADVGGSETQDETDAVYAAFDEPPTESVEAERSAAESFATVDEALPVDEPPRAEEPVPATAETEPFFFDAPPPPPGFDQPFATLEMDAPPEPVAADDSRSTVELEMDTVPDAATTQALEEETTGEMVPPTPPEVTAAQEADRPPFFVPKFRAFYNEIVSHKHQKAEFTAGFATAVMDYAADLSPDAAAQALQKRLSEILELQAAEATWMGGEAAARYPDAQYAMAALADEVFTHIDWAGKDAWPRHMVEQRLFKSNAKDVEFFRRVDKLLKNEADHPSPAAKDLARMYLLVLAAGFQGKYRPFGLTRPLADYRRRLYEFVSGKDPLLIYAEEQKLFPDAAERVVVGRAVSRFSMLQQWAAVLVILLIGYAVISQMAWNRVSADLKDVTARVEAANTSATSDGLAGDPR